MGTNKYEVEITTLMLCFEFLRFRHFFTAEDAFCTYILTVGRTSILGAKHLIPEAAGAAGEHNE